MNIRESFDRSSSECIRLPGSTASGTALDGASHQVEDSPYDQSHSTTSLSDPSAAVHAVLKSDIAITTLLNRLKQSIASAREFAAFLKKRSNLEEEHAQGLKKVCKSSYESARRPDNRQGSYAQNYSEVIRIHDRMADNGIQFALSLHQMHEDLHDLAANIERGRKHWKQNGLNAEKRVQDSESMMEKAKAKYDSLAEDYDRARTGDKQASRVFGLKGPKSAAQHEEDLNKKVQAADSDYSAKVQSAQSQRQELINTLRPQAIKAMQDLINECDSGLTLQLQKFAAFNEKLLLSNGLCINPLKQSTDSHGPWSLRDVVYQIDNEADLQAYLLNCGTKVVSKSMDIKYERHPTLTSPQQMPTSSVVFPHATQAARSSMLAVDQNDCAQHSGSTGQIHNPTQGAAPPTSIMASPENVQNGSMQIVAIPHTENTGASHLSTTQAPSTTLSQSPTPISGLPQDSLSTDLPSARPVFGVSLEDLLKRDGSAIPLVVYQCLQAIDLFGLEVEGIYRLSGSAVHVAKLRSLFDNGSNHVDFRNPEHFFHDVNSVAGLLKQFFRELPDPLLTREHYQSFIDAARIDDDITRRDSLHATINSLPDPNYATLRALTLHLHRVQERSSVNRMNAGNLALCFGPTLMGFNTGSSIADAGWQVRVIDTILQNTYQIFDDD